MVYVKDRNNTSRYYNSAVATRPGVPMRPLYSLVTGDATPEFSTTIQDINPLDRMIKPLQLTYSWK